jgi:hypothetical protein
MTQKEVDHVHVTWIYDELLPDGTVHRHLWEQIYYQRSEETLSRIMEKCGLEIHAIYGDYDFSSYQKGSNRLLLQGRIQKR